MVTRLSGGLTPADGADPRTFPAIWNVTADTIEAQGSAVLPSGGSAGQVLVKDSGTDYDADWERPLERLSDTGAWWPDAITGEYIATPSDTQTGQVEGRVRFLPFWSPYPLAIDRIAVRVSTAGSVGSVVRIGVYADNQGMPSTLLLDAGTVNSETTGVKEITVSLTLPAGRCWLAGVVQGGAATVARCNGASTAAFTTSGFYRVAGGGGLDATYWAMTRTTGIGGGTVSGALPDPAFDTDRPNAMDVQAFAFKMRLA